MSSSPSTSASIVDDDSEWEYEYDDAETETFYVCLDLSAANRLHKLTNSRTKSTAKSQPTNSDSIHDENENEDKLQILDIDTRTPVVSYRDHIYSCKWADSIGTELFFAVSRNDDIDSSVTDEERSQSQSQNINDPEAAREPEPRVELVALSATKIVGEPVTLTHKVGYAPLAAHSADSASTSQPLPIYVPPTANLAKKAQAKFLSSFINIKNVKSEKDSVRLHSIRRHPGPGRLVMRESEREARIQELGCKVEELAKLESDAKDGDVAQRLRENINRLQVILDVDAEQRKSMELGDKVESDDTADVSELDPSTAQGELDELDVAMTDVA